MKRDRWEFEFTSSKLAEAAGAKRDHHSKRLEFWQKTQAMVMDEIRKTGINVEETQSDIHSNAYHGPRVVVDNSLQRKLNEAVMKVEEHRGRVEEYEGWLQVLTANSGRTYSLNADDYLFFFGK